MITGIEIANNIRAERNRANLSMDQVVKEIQLTRQTYAEYEKNAENVRASVLVKLSKIFNCNISDFFIQK